ncbi:MAG: tetratricopeptide repeat protein [Nitrospirota bacterium]
MSDELVSKNISEETDLKVKTGDTVRIHFTCTLEDGTIIDSSVNKEPLEFTLGKGEVLFPGLEDAVIGMYRGESKSITIPAEKAYGVHLPEKIFTISRTQFPPTLEPVIGMKFEIQQTDGKMTVVRVTDVQESCVTLDTNHPLAGKDLFFEIQLLDQDITDMSKAHELYQQGTAYQDRGQLDEAISCYQKAVKLDPKLFKAFYNLGVAFQNKGNIDTSILYYEIALGLNPEFLEAYHNLGIAYKDKGQFDDAIMCFLRAIQIKADHVGAYYNLGNTLVANGRYNEALQIYKKVLDIKPDYPDAHLAISMLNLRLGNFQDGWKGYEYRWKLEENLNRREYSKPLWDGSDLQGKSILLSAEQGFGDTIQFIRYVPLLAQRGSKIIVECQKELSSLIRNIKGVHTVVSRGEQIPEYDVYCPLLSLPLMIGTTLQNIPANIPYISVGPELKTKWAGKISRFSHTMKIGLVWAGHPKPKFGHTRSCPLNLFFPLREFEKITVFSLQMNNDPHREHTLEKDLPIIDFTGEIKDFHDTAAFIENLDLIISVDTAVAHLAGALGRPVWTLLPFVADWRWLENREDSPWYPTMRLFRQPAIGDWESVIDRIFDSLKVFLRN